MLTLHPAVKTSMKTWQWLGYLGLIPFLACLWLFEMSFDGSANNLLFNPQQGFVFYSAIILSFLAGVLWRKESGSFLAGVLWRKESGSEHSKAQIISNIFCLYAYLCLFLPGFYALIFLPFGYLSLFLAEYLLCNNKQDAFTNPYFIMRFRLTLLVSVLHGIALISWF